MTRAYLAFTNTGLALARRLADALPGSVDRCGSGGVSLAGWTALQFAQSDALVLWEPWALRCGPLRRTAAARHRTLPWWCWTNAAALRCRCCPVIWAVPMTWPVHWPPCAEPFR